MNKLVQIGSDWIKLDQLGLTWHKLDQIGSNWNKLDQTWSNWIKIDQIFETWGWGLVPHSYLILCLFIFDYWKTWLKLVMLENLQACWIRHYFKITGKAQILNISQMCWLILQDQNLVFIWVVQFSPWVCYQCFLNYKCRKCKYNFS